MVNEINLDKNIQDSMKVWDNVSPEGSITLGDLLRRDNIPEDVIQQIPESSINKSIPIPEDARFAGVLCKSFSFDLLGDQISINGSACLDGDVEVTIRVFGFDVTLSGDASIGNDGLCYKANFFGQSLSVCLSFDGNCLSTKGKLSTFFFNEGWDQKIFCFK